MRLKIQSQETDLCSTMKINSATVKIYFKFVLFEIILAFR